MLAAQVFNAAEALFWLALAAGVSIAPQDVRGLTLGRSISLALLLIAFGVSDAWEFYELRRGAAASAGLLVCKGACLMGLALVAAKVYSERWRPRKKLDKRK